jgi:hypothetical protein
MGKSAFLQRKKKGGKTDCRRLEQIIGLYTIKHIFTHYRVLGGGGFVFVNVRNQRLYIDMIKTCSRA